MTTPAATSTAGPQVTTTTTQMPTWYDQLSQQFGQAVSGALGNQMNGTWYTDQVDAQGNRLPISAGIDPLQQQALEMGQGALGQWTPSAYQASSLYAQSQAPLTQMGNTINQMSAGLGQADQYGQAAGNLYGNAAGTAGMMSQGLGQAQSTLGQAQGALGGMTQGLGQGQQAWNTAAGMVGQAGQGLQSAGQYDPSQMQQHLNPYLSGVNQAIAREGQRNLTENLLPQVNSTFAGAGQFGSTRNADFTNRALRDTQTAVLDTQAKAMNQAYGQAAQDYLGWGQLGAQTAGKYGDLANTLAGIGQTQAQTPASILGQQAGLGTSLGQAQGQLPSQVYGAQAGMMGNLGQNVQSLGRDYATLPSQIYGAQAGMYGTQAGALQGLGGAFQGLGNMQAQNTWNDVNQTMNLGTQGQQIAQAPLTAAYQNWLTQQQFPIEMGAKLGGVLSQLGAPYQRNTTQSVVGAPGIGLSSAEIALLTGLAGAGGTTK